MDAESGGAEAGDAGDGNTGKWNVGTDKSNVTDYKSTFFERHPDLKGTVVVHHSIERQVLKKYPDIFTSEEIHAYENLRGIPNEINNEVHLSKIRKEWNQFYKDVAKGKIKLTRESFFSKAKEIDKMFGNQFKPNMK